MSPRSSLLKRAIVPLLAVAAAAALCAPTRAATATLDDCRVVQNGTQVGIAERVKCSIDESRWQSVTLHAQLLGGGNTLSWTPSGDPPGTPNGHPPFDIWGPGDYYYPGAYYDSYVGDITDQHGTYNCWAVCSGLDYYGAVWYASTGGTYYVTY